MSAFKKYFSGNILVSACILITFCSTSALQAASLYCFALDNSEKNIYVSNIYTYSGKQILSNDYYLNDKFDDAFNKLQAELAYDKFLEAKGISRRGYGPHCFHRNSGAGVWNDKDNTETIAFRKGYNIHLIKWR